MQCFYWHTQIPAWTLIIAKGVASTHQKCRVNQPHPSGKCCFRKWPTCYPYQTWSPWRWGREWGHEIEKRDKESKMHCWLCRSCGSFGKKKSVCIWKGRVLALAVLPTKFGKSLLLLCTTSLWLLARKRRQVFFNVAGMLAAPIRSDSILIIAFILHIGHMIKETTMRTDLQARCPWQSQVNHKSNT